MSFRYISVWPTCLHVRLASRPNALPRSLKTCQTCRYTLASTISCESETNDFQTEVVVNKHAKPRDSYPGSSPAQAALSSRSIHRNRSKPTKSYNVDHSSVKHSKTRAGQALDVSDFIQKPLGSHRSTKKADKDRNSLSTLSINKGTVTHGYKRWEDLHDKFLEIRRTRPEETHRVFEEQRMLAKRILGDISNAEVACIEFQCKWHALTKVQQHQLLPALLIGSLAESAFQALFVLSNVPYMANSFLVRMNCLRHIGIMYKKELWQDTDSREVYQTQIAKLRSPDTWPKNKLPTVLLQNLLYRSTPEQCQQIIRDFSETYPNADPSSVIAIIDHYLRIEDREQAFEYFKSLPQDILQEPDVVVKGLRDRLLRLDFVEKTDTGANFKYLPQLLALGIPSDEAVHNIVIESAVLSEMPDVAWDVYQYLESSKFQSNARSHLVLLRDSFNRGNAHRVDAIMTAIHNRDDLIEDKYLMAYSMNIIRNISYYEKRLQSKEARSHIIALYDRAYDRGPLVRLGIAQPTANTAILPEPPSSLLAFTIWTYILVHRRESDVVRLWEWMKHLITNGDQSVIEAAKYDIIFNGFILFFCRKPETLFRALDVMQYMLSGELSLPTSRTWSIVLCALLKHQHIEQAARVLDLMRSRGFRVEEITERYGEYVPEGYDLQAMSDRVDAGLDETKMPDNIEELLSDSPSLQGEGSFRES